MAIKDFIIAFATTFGGLEAIKWGVHTWMYRKTEKRKQAAEASAAEIANYHKQVDWLQNRLQACYTQMEQLHKRLHDSQLELEDWIRRFNALETAMKEAEKWTCYKTSCAGREKNKNQ